jgi:hypothetical protein
MWTKTHASRPEKSSQKLIVLAYCMTVLVSSWMLSASPGLAHDLPVDTNVLVEMSAEEVVANYLEAIGGADAVKAVVSKRITYWVHMFGRDAYLMESHWTRPHNKRTGHPGATTYTLTEGERSWRVSPEGRRQLPAAVSRSLSKLADIDGPLVDSVEKGVTLAYSGVVHYDGFAPGHGDVRGWRSMGVLLRYQDRPSP